MSRGLELSPALITERAQTNYRLAASHAFYQIYLFTTLFAYHRSPALHDYCRLTATDSFYLKRLAHLPVVKLDVQGIFRAWDDLPGRSVFPKKSVFRCHAYYVRVAD